MGDVDDTDETALIAGIVAGVALVAIVGVVAAVLLRKKGVRNNKVEPQKAVELASHPAKEQTNSNNSKSDHRARTGRRGKRPAHAAIAPSQDNAVVSVGTPVSIAL